jgi:glycerol-3-phosphate O-acyltransferase
MNETHVQTNPETDPPPSPQTSILEKSPSRMLRRFGWIHRTLGLGRMLKRLKLDQSSVQRILDAHGRGPLVYVLLHNSNIDYLALNHVLNERRLPLSVWANTISNRWWAPFPEMAVWLYRTLLKGPRFLRKTPDPRAWIFPAIQQRETIAICLDTKAPTQTGRTDPLAGVMEAQEQSEQPIQLLPVIIVWTRAPGKTVNPALRFLTDRSPITHPFHQLFNIVFRSRRAFVQVGEAIQIPELMDRVPPQRRSRALSILLRRYLKREAKVIQGPRIVARHQMKDLVLNNYAMKRLAEEEATVTGASRERVQRRMEREFRQIAAHFRPWLVPILDLVLRPLWTRVYDGVDIPPEDMERIRAAMRQGSIILAPCHKSHFDYVLLSWVFYDHKLVIPHIVAGSNLAMPVLAWFLRSAGAFFIKRSFAGERLHPAIFGRYLQELTRQGYPIEFYIEGGRTRSGKFNTPKLGVLRMVLDAAAVRPSNQEITILPMSIAYEQVAEQAAYEKELTGSQKTTESLGQVAKATRVIRRRYGKVYIRVGESIKCSQLVDEKEGQQGWQGLGRHESQELLQITGEKIIHRIGQVAVLIPTSLVALGLLAHHRRGITHQDLIARLKRFHAFLTQTHTPMAKSLNKFDEAVALALARFRQQGVIDDTSMDGQRVWSISIKGRHLLDYYKNNSLHFFLHAGLTAAAIRGVRKEKFLAQDLMPGFSAVCWLLRREFVLDPDHAISEHLQTGLEQLQRYGVLARDGEFWAVQDTSLIAEMYSLFRSILESYWLVLTQADETRPMDEKEYSKQLIQKQEEWISSGTITRPEALSKITLSQALKSLREDGLFEHNKKGLHRVSVEGRQDVLGWLNPMVHE